MVHNLKNLHIASGTTRLDAGQILRNIRTISSATQDLSRWTYSVIKTSRKYEDALTSCTEKDSEACPTEAEKEAARQHILEICERLLGESSKPGAEMPKVNAVIKETVKDKHIVKYRQWSEANITVSDKHIAKSDAKEELPAKKRKFKIGKLYTLKSKTKGTDYRVTRTYQLKQIVWTMGDVQVNGLVVKQVAGPDNHATAFLSITDCRNLHVKYEAGLQILPMSLNWQEKKNQ